MKTAWEISSIMCMVKNTAQFQRNVSGSAGFYFLFYRIQKHANFCREKTTAVFCSSDCRHFPIDKTVWAQLPWTIVAIRIQASLVYIGNRHKIGHCFMMSWKSTIVYITQYKLKIWVWNSYPISGKQLWHGKVIMTTAPLNQANKGYTAGCFLSTCISKGSAHSSLAPHTVSWVTMKSTTWLSLTTIRPNSHRVISKGYCVKECWCYIN